MWKVIVDISPRTIEGTNGCHKYVFAEHKTKKEAIEIRDSINQVGNMGKAYIERTE